jgi:hypothetical protein
VIGQGITDHLPLIHARTIRAGVRATRGYLLSFGTAQARSAGLGVASGRTLSSRLPVSGFERGSFMACAPAGCRGEAWLEKGLRALEVALPVLAQVTRSMARRR